MDAGQTRRAPPNSEVPKPQEGVKKPPTRTRGMGNQSFLRHAASGFGVTRLVWCDVPQTTAKYGPCVGTNRQLQNGQLWVSGSHKLLYIGMAVLLETETVRIGSRGMPESIRRAGFAVITRAPWPVVGVAVRRGVGDWGPGR